MPSFSTDAFRTPFGKNVYLRSTQDVKTTSYTFAHDSLPTITVDGVEQRVLQPGDVLAVITSGADTGKVGVFQDAGSGADEVQTITENTAVTAGTFTVTLFGGTGGEVTTDAIAFDATAADVQTALRAAAAESTDLDYSALSDDIVVTGGPVGTTPLTVTYNGSSGIDLPQLTVDDASLTGTVTIATTTPGVEGAIDGRGDTANIVGINNTFLPWQLMERDVEVAVVYEASVVQANCRKLNAAGVPVALDNTTAAEMFAKKSLDIRFH